MKARRVWFSILLALVIVVTAALPASSAAYVPTNMVALGDSISRAYNTGSSAFTDAPANSWTTGTSTTVNSMYLRFRPSNPSLTAVNYAVSGAKMIDLNGQASKMAPAQDYVTILIGANDVCTSSESTMTPVSTFQAQFQTALTTIKAKNPNAVIYVVSIPNIYNLWSVLKGNSTARFTWSLYRICQSMLYNPTSTKSADVQRRERVKQRNIDFNNVMQSACAATAKCYFDNHAVFNTSFVPSDISTRDYFHPSVAGQAKLARVAWDTWKLLPDR